jgi:hypothetical protein
MKTHTRWTLHLLVGLLLALSLSMPAWAEEKPVPRLWLPLLAGGRPTPCICLPHGG